MITFSRLGNHGHLGNQMFQYASTVGIARNNHCSPGFPQHTEFGTYYPARSSLHDCFDLPEEPLVQTVRTYEELATGFDRQLFANCTDDTDLFGYFQSYKYFENIRDEIIDRFSFKESVRSRAVVPQDTYTTVHVRRTDYLGVQAVLPNLSATDYYARARELAPSTDLTIIMSDDIEWCKLYFNDDSAIFSGQDPYTELFLMTHADVNIIANSSFSWWGAWLNDKSIKIAPKTWFGPAIGDYRIDDLIPSSWLLI